MKRIMTLAMLLCGSTFVCSAQQEKSVAPDSGQSQASQNAQAQDDQDETRRIWDDEMVGKRKPGRKPLRLINHRYRRITPPSHPTLPNNETGKNDRTTPPVAQPPKTGMVEHTIGVTLWRLRPAGSAPAQKDEARIIIQDANDEESNKKPTVWTQERITSDTQFNAGELVRMSIEAPFTGFLYVIDREQYRDGTFSAPYLIFPTRHTHGGQNKVEAGDLIDIPGQKDQPFRLAPSRPDQVAEVLTIIVSPIRLGVPLKDKLFALSEEQVKEWERKWSVMPERLELEGGAGKTLTRAEQEAGEETRKLTQDDPPPQTIYRLRTAPNDAALISVSLVFANNGSSSDK